MSLWTHLAQFATFETERLILRPFRYEDSPAFYQIISNPDNLSFVFPPLVDEKEALELMVAVFIQQPLGVWAIEDKKSHLMIGAIRLEKVKESNGQAELGYFLRKDYWNQGLMTEAVKNVSYLSFYHLGLRELLIVTHLENIASQKVAEKVGYTLFRQYKGSDRYTHKMRDYLAFSLRKSELILEKEENI